MCWGDVSILKRVGNEANGAYQELFRLADEQAGGGERRLLLVGWRCCWCCDGLPARGGGGYYWGLIIDVVMDAEV